MVILSRGTLRDFGRIHPDAKAQLDAWFHEAAAANWSSPADIKRHYGNASILHNDRIVFNICGNKYRLIVRVHYATRTVFIRFIGTHAQYDKIDAHTA
ncbi:MAG: type II toxin-antitoxin system HigB family toxin [Phycisphaerales bacterium]|jgi:mRNA interferase HigB|nr:type II toxin-antitoxin system HigB family toxin [Phycisphaerales bacterium]